MGVGTGPITTALEAQVRRDLEQRGTIVWLDKDGLYNAYVDDLARRHRDGRFPYPVVAFRGSFLELMLAQESLASGVDNTPLLIHLPGYNEESIRKTPVLELYEVGQRYRVALDTLVRQVAAGSVEPAEIERFVTAAGLSLATADEWLEGHRSVESGGFRAMLEKTGTALLVGDLLVKREVLPRHLHGRADLAELRGHLHRQTGMDERWIAFFDAVHEDRDLADELSGLAFAFAGWILCVEYVHDLARPPYLSELQPLRDLASPYVERCRDLVRQLRDQHGDHYAQYALDVEARIKDEIEHIAPTDLGKIDTFQREEARVLEDAILALAQKDWARARTAFEVREGGQSYWIKRDQARRWAWILVGEAARFGAMLDAAGRPLEGIRTVEEAVGRYAPPANGKAQCPSPYEVDRAHRQFEQKRLALLNLQVPHFGALREVVGLLRRQYRAWADHLAKDFTQVCRACGPLPEDTLQQRTLYDQVVHPLTAGGERVAVFLIDAFRYEMATELREELQGPGGTVDLKARLAELPTLTKVGMNVLAPVVLANGRLRPALDRHGDLQGFRSGEYTVATPEQRARAMGTRSGSAPGKPMSLEEVGNADPATLKRIVAQCPLLVIHSRELDDAGEAGFGLDAFERVLRDVKTAWHHLQAAGVRQFVFTADHGFLLLDETVQVQAYGRKTDPGRRHVVADDPRGEAGMFTVSMSALGYDDAPGYLLFREDTSVFDTGKALASFVHGGNSLQERVIPVLTVTQKREPGMATAAYAIEAEPQRDLLDLRALRVRVRLSKDSGGMLVFTTASTIDLALRVPDRPDVKLTLRDLRGPGEIRGSRLRTPVGDEWTEVYFSLEGPRVERTQVEVHHPDGVERVEACTLQTLFAVTGTGARPSVRPPAEVPWPEQIADEGARKVFLHLQAHGSVSEEQLVAMLGSPRAVRRFALAFDEHQQRVPFLVRIVTVDGSKRYVKDVED